MQILADLDRQLDNITQQVTQLSADADRLIDYNRTQVQRLHDTARSIMQQIDVTRTEVRRLATQWGTQVQPWQQPGLGQPFAAGQPFAGSQPWSAGFGGFGGGYGNIDEKAVYGVVKNVLQQMQSGNASQRPTT